MEWFRPESGSPHLPSRRHGPSSPSAETLEVIGHAIALIRHRRPFRSDDSFRARSLRLRPNVPRRRPNGPAAPATYAAPGCDGAHRPRHAPSRCPGLAIDLGGIGKGLAADLVATGLVDGRGRCRRRARRRCTGRRAPGRRIPHGRFQSRIHERSRTMGTRAFVDQARRHEHTRFRRWRRGDAVMHHLIDPATGAPRRGVGARSRKPTTPGGPRASPRPPW